MTTENAESTEKPASAPVNLDDLLTVEQFAAWRQEPVSSVRKRLASMPGVVRESRENVRVHPRTYLEGRLGKKRK